MTPLLLPVDGCPNCVTEGHVVYVHPSRVEPGGLGARAWYRCPECSYSWWTAWAGSALSRPCPRCPACAQAARGGAA